MTPKERYHLLRKKGLCGQCGRMPAASGCRCEFCNDLHNERNRRKKSSYRDGRARYRSRRERGLCVTCGVPVNRFARCLRCRERVAASVQRVRKHSWTYKYDHMYREAA